jgi:hypothetical protein
MQSYCDHAPGKSLFTSITLQDSAVPILAYLVVLDWFPLCLSQARTVLRVWHRVHDAGFVSALYHQLFRAYVAVLPAQALCDIGLYSHEATVMSKQPQAPRERIM